MKLFFENQKIQKYITFAQNNYMVGGFVGLLDFVFAWRGDSGRVKQVSNLTHVERETVVACIGQVPDGLMLATGNQLLHQGIVGQTPLGQILRQRRQVLTWRVFHVENGRW